MEDLKRASSRSDLQTTESVRFIAAQLEAISGRIRASRTRPLDRVAMAELTSLRFAATRLSRRLRLLASDGADLSEVHLLDPARELINELGDASAEAARRGVLISLRVRELDRVSRKINFIDSLASLVEDGIDAGANYLSLETRHTADQAELCLTTDAEVPSASLGLRLLGSLGGQTGAVDASPARAKTRFDDSRARTYAVHVDAIECSLTRISISVHAHKHAAWRNHGAKRWSPSPSRV